MRRRRVLVLSRSYPSAALPTLGLWVRRMVEVGGDGYEATVVAPVPWTPPLPLPKVYRRFRSVPRFEMSDCGVPVHHPRVPLLPGSRFQAWESGLFLPVLRPLVTRLHREAPFDLLHAHFIYPDGVIAARLSRELGVPVVTTEHAHWVPWMETRPATWRQVEASLDAIDTITAVSEAVRRGVEGLTRGRVRTALLPNVLDDHVFTTDGNGGGRDPDRILFVGAVRWVKGFDILLEAFHRLLERRPAARLEVVGEPFFPAYRRDFANAMDFARALGVEARVDIRGSLPPHQVAEAMRRATVLAVPSRRESFSSVTVEALACGLPVVATRCGGPEEILTEETGRVVEPGDAAAFADALHEVMETRPCFDPEGLRRHAVERYGREAARRRLTELYGRVLENAAAPKGGPTK